MYKHINDSIVENKIYAHIHANSEFFTEIFALQTVMLSVYKSSR